MGVPTASVKWATLRVSPNGRMADSLLIAFIDADCERYPEKT
jgi:hypothetical protein